MLPIVRTFISTPAGAAHMNFAKFTIYTALGCIPWVLMLGYIGVKVGENWEEWRDKLHYFDYVVLAGLIALAVYAFVKWRRGGGGGERPPRAHRRPRPPPPPRADGLPEDVGSQREWELIPPPIPTGRAIALGAVQGPAELLPVSSSAHLSLIPWLADWDWDSHDAELRKSFEIALHAGAAAALLLGQRR